MKDGTESWSLVWPFWSLVWPFLATVQPHRGAPSSETYVIKRVYADYFRRLTAATLKSHTSDLPCFFPFCIGIVTNFTKRGPAECSSLCLVNREWKAHTHWWWRRWFQHVGLLSSARVFCNSVSSAPCTSGNLRGKGRGPRWWHKVCVNPLEWIIKGYSTWDYQTYYYVKSD